MRRGVLVIPGAFFVYAAISINLVWKSAGIELGGV